MILNISSNDVKHEVDHMAKNSRARRSTRPVELTIVERISANPELAHALGLEANAMDSVAPEVADRLNQTLKKAQPPCDRTATLSPFNIVDHLHTQEDMEVYLQACIEEDPGDGSLIRRAQQDIAHATRKLNTKP
ncbi:hypothetical protein AO063_01175 [Pseudomonas fluorescens ICMP 11288]|uniref:Uncharacterized protein n=4 Tax=Pseudomonas TaxID=286 RepID=A0A0W0I5D8_PSEFL|nr:hypothetical protein AO063_01175 [Pseudomonas fluorescens ICMP 11288]